MALALGVAAAAVACTTTVIDRSARPRDAATTWNEQMARASRFHRGGFYSSADRHYGNALESAQAFPPGDERIAQTLSQRAELRLAQGRYDGAGEDYRAIVAFRRSNSRVPDSALTDALNDLATFYTDLNRIDEARSLLREATQIRAALYGADHPYVAVLLQNLGDAERRAGNYAAAERYLTHALSIYSTAGEDFYRTASVAQNNLGRVYRHTDHEQESEKNHIDAIRLSIRASGERNTDVGVFSRDLANLYTQQRRIDEAEGLYKGSIEILRDGLGDSSYQLSKTYRDYADMLTSVGRRREAAEYRRRADATGYE